MMSAMTGKRCEACARTTYSPVNDCVGKSTAIFTVCFMDLTLISKSSAYPETKSAMTWLLLWSPKRLYRWDQASVHE